MTCDVCMDGTTPATARCYDAFDRSTLYVCAEHTEPGDTPLA